MSDIDRRRHEFSLLTGWHTGNDDIREVLPGYYYHESAMREVVRALRDWMNEIGECTCHEAYTIRKLTDPNCHHHDYGEVREETDTLLAHYKDLLDAP